jgi:hypothetical protein
MLLAAPALPAHIVTGENPVVELTLAALPAVELLIAIQGDRHGSAAIGGGRAGRGGGESGAPHGHVAPEGSVEDH